MLKMSTHIFNYFNNISNVKTRAYQQYKWYALKQMLTLSNITVQDQSEFSISIENMKDAHTVKVLRWAMPSLIPLHNAVEVNVVNE